MILRAFCETSNVLQIFYFINMIVKILCYVVPAILILMLSIDIFKIVMSGEDSVIKNNMKMIVKRIIFAVAIFFVPMIVNISFGLLGNMNVSAADCYNNATPSKIEKIKSDEVSEYEEYKAKVKAEKDKEIKNNQDEEQKRIKASSSSNSSSANSASYGNVFDVSNVTDYTQSSGKIGEARTGSGGKLSGDKAGDQSGKEVAISNFSYSSKTGKSKHWKYVARFKDPKRAEIAARTMEAACNNPHIGYDYSSKKRVALYAKAKAVNWDISKIKTNTTCSCATLISVCINASGIKISKSIAASSMRSKIEATGAFKILTDKKYLTSYKYLKRGDILVSSKHTAMAL